MFYNCKQLKERFSDYADGLMSAVDARAFAKHIADCTQCAADYKLFTATTAALDAIPEVDIPDGLHSAIMRSVRSGAVPSKSKWWQMGWLPRINARVPARALATGLALTFLFALLQTLTPVGTMTANLMRPKPEVKMAQHQNMALANWGPWGGTTRTR